LVVHGDAGLAVLDDEEPDPAATLDGEGLTGREVPLLHRARDLLELLPAEVGEERYALEEVDGGSGHGAFMPDAGLRWKRHANLPRRRRCSDEVDDRRLFACLAQSGRGAVGVPRGRSRPAPP